MKSFLRFSFFTLAVFGGAFLFSSHKVYADNQIRPDVLPADLIVCPVNEVSGNIQASLVNDVVGDDVSFYVDKGYDYYNRSSLTATLRAEGVHVLVYVDDNYYNSLSSSGRQDLVSGAASLSRDFDNVIYPRVTAFYGKPWEPGIDGDGRITILLMRLVGSAGGYTNTTDEYPKTQAPTSNQREMFYLNAVYYSQPRRLDIFASHEFTHVINFYQKDKSRGVPEEIWLNELRAEYAPTVAGYDVPFSGSNVESRASVFEANPSDSLTLWGNSQSDYGAINMFGHYLAGRYGEKIWADTMQTSLVGIASINEALAKEGFSNTFSRIFENFETANFVNNGALGQDYAYAQSYLSASNFQVKTVTNSSFISASSTVSFIRTVYDWSGHWFKVVPTGGGSGENLLITVKANVPVGARAILTKNDGSKSVEVLSGVVAGVISLSIPQVGGLSDVVVVPVTEGKTSGFDTGLSSSGGVLSEEPLRSLEVTFERVSSDTPVITSVSPSQVLIYGGALVSVSGSSFLKGAVSINIDGVNILGVKVLSDDLLTFVAPSHALGSACLQVLVGAKSVQSCNAVSYVAFGDGDLLKASSSPDVWIVKGRFIRHIVSPRIFDFYKSLSWENLKIVPDNLLAQFFKSAWVRLPLTQDPLTWRIYEINDDATKHWITCANQNNCAATWAAHGGNPQGVYTINNQEMGFYEDGAKVFLQ